MVINVSDAASNISKFRINQTIQVFRNDADFLAVLADEGISYIETINGIPTEVYLSQTQYTDLAELMLNHNNTLSANTIDELNSMVPSYLREDIVAILEKTYIELKTYKQIIYTYKYSTIKRFFKENYVKFLPEYDFVNIQSQEKLRIFQESFMQEYDRFAAVIDNIYNIVDIDKTPQDYLNYLAQVIGYEREDRQILGDVSFRELIKNMVEVYKIKGTNFSFELFFNFLGFEVDLKEYWFDRRYSDSGITTNPYTSSTDRNKFLFYLTTEKPTEDIPDGMSIPYLAKENEIIETLDVNEFDALIAAGTYSPKQLMGLIDGYSGTAYSYFKTNVIQYSLTAITEIDTETDIEGGEAELDTGGLSEEQIASINKYADFLTPIFIQRNIIINIPPYEERADGIFVTDESRPDPRSENPLNTDADDSTFVNDENMFHFYSGRQPAGYYWDDGVRFYEDPIPNPDGQRWTIKDGSYGPAYIEPGGFGIGGNFDDDFQGNVYDRNDPTLDSLYYQLSQANPSWTEQELLEEISRQIGTGEIFNYYETFYEVKTEFFRTTGLITDGSLVPSTEYAVAQTGTAVDALGEYTSPSDFTTVGAESSAAGTVFTATGTNAGGDGKVRLVKTMADINTEVASRLTGVPYISIPEREVMYPLIDYPDTQERDYDIESDFSIGTPHKLAYSPDSLRAQLKSGQKRRVSYEEEPYDEYYTRTEVVLDGDLEIGTEYTVFYAGTSDFTTIGAASNTEGTVFTATAADSGGDGKVTQAVDKYRFNKVDVNTITPNSKYSAFTSNLVVCYPVDENFGQSVFDISGNRNDGIMHGAYFTNVEGEESIYFDGSSYVTVPSYTVHLANDPFSASIWFRGDAADLPAEGRVCLVSKSAFGAASSLDGVRIEATGVSTGSGKIVVTVGNGGSTSSWQTTSSYIDGEWHNVFITSTGSAATVYVDDTAETGSLNYSGVSVDSTSPLTLGAVFDPNGLETASQEFTGYIKSFALWSSQLTATNKTTIYNNESNSPTATVVTQDDEQRFKDFEVASDTSNNDLLGTFTAGSNIITNIEYSYELAPIWTTDGIYTVGDWRRDNNSVTDVYECLVGYDNNVEGDSGLTDSPANWQLIKGITSLEKGRTIYSPRFLFGAEVVYVDRVNKQARLSKKSNQSITDQNLVFVENEKGFVKLGGLRRVYDNNVFKVLSKTSTLSGTDPGPYTRTTSFTLDKPLQDYSTSATGIVKNFFEAPLLRKFRYPFLWNYIELIERIGAFVYRGIVDTPITLSGDAIVDFLVQYIYTMAGEVKIGETTTLYEFLLRYLETGSGLINVTGTNVPDITWTELVSGLINVTGTNLGIPNYLYFPNGDGKILITPTTTVYDFFLSYRTTGSGGIDVTGDATELITAYRYLASNDPVEIVLSGDTLHTIEVDFTGVGGIDTSGSATIVGPEVLRVRGTADYNVEFVFEPEGGIIELQGDAITFAKREDAIRMSGEAEVSSWSL